MPLLFWTVDRLLTAAAPEADAREGGVFLMCSSFSYDDETEAEIDAQCATFGLQRQVIQCALASNGTRIQQFKRIVQ